MYIAAHDTVAAAEAAGSFKTVTLRHPDCFLKYGNNMQKLYNMHRKIPTERIPPLVLMLVGDPGTGKTYNVLKHLGEEACYEQRYIGVGGEMVWPDLDTAVHRYLVLDEFKGQVRSDRINKIIEGAGVLARQAGGQIERWHPQIVIIISNTYPRKWTMLDWKDDTTEASLARRVHFCPAYIEHNFQGARIGDYFDDIVWNPVASLLAACPEDTALPVYLGSLQNQQNGRRMLLTWAEGQARKDSSTPALQL